MHLAVLAGDFLLSRACVALASLKKYSFSPSDFVDGCVRELSDKEI